MKIGPYPVFCPCFLPTPRHQMVQKCRFKGRFGRGCKVVLSKTGLPRPNNCHDTHHTLPGNTATTTNTTITTVNPTTTNLSKNVQSWLRRQKQTKCLDEILIDKSCFRWTWSETLWWFNPNGWFQTIVIILIDRKVLACWPLSLQPTATGLYNACGPKSHQ